MNAHTPSQNIGEPRARLLVVTSEPQARRWLAELLRSRLDCDVDVAATGGRALEHVIENGYDLVVADAHLADMSSIEFCLWVREARPQMAERVALIGITPQPAPVEAESLGVPVIGRPLTVSRIIDFCARFVPLPQVTLATLPD